ncbi:FAD-binding oxidoreductase [Roseovarius nubinhibens]|uniref:NAD(P)/FAD-dependent oxidoreductase n=1 Tax=Roseovarius nubinhibens TaxID=314263 RepID=UPI001C08EABD|nr:FAD-binding oxidoreductase [Roseovarius nubinhibens]
MTDLRPDESVYWDHVTPPETPALPLPARTDVAVIGAGYTGLATALHLARAGRQVTLFEAGGLGAGCSSRNGGMVGPSFHKLGVAGLTARYGAAKTLDIMGEGLRALEYFEGFVADEGLDCDLQMRGRFRGARTRADYEATGRECDWLARHLGLPCEMIPEAEQHREIGSAAYRGGVVYHRDGGVHPRKLLLALAQKAQAAGVAIHCHCPVTGLHPDGDATTLTTPQGKTVAREVVMATNAYADGATRAMHRRVVQIRTAAVATEPLGAEVMRALTPKGRMLGESGRIFMWYRPSPDGERFIFGGRLGRPGGPAETQRRAFATAVTRVFPQLSDVGFSHVWSGSVAYTPDHSPHLGRYDGVWLAGGYCGSGVTRSVYFGMKLARKILGQPEADTAFDDLGFPTVPYKPFSGLGAQLLTRWYSHLDARDLRRD